MQTENEPEPVVEYIDRTSAEWAMFAASFAASVGSTLCNLTMSDRQDLAHRMPVAACDFADRLTRERNKRIAEDEARWREATGLSPSLRPMPGAGQ